MKRKILFLVFLFTSCFVFAQSNSTLRPFINGQMNISLSGIHYQRFDKLAPKVEILYGINNWLETGLFGSGIGYKFFDNEGTLYRPCTVLIGAEGKAHLFPAIINSSFHYVDLYAITKIGTKYYISDGYHPEQSGMGWFFSGGVGAAANISRHFGLFYEWQYNSLRTPTHSFGLNIRFGGPKKWQK